MKNKRVVWVNCELQKGNEWEISLERQAQCQAKGFQTRQNAVTERQIVDQYLVVIWS